MEITLVIVALIAFVGFRQWRKAMTHRAWWRATGRVRWNLTTTDWQRAAAGLG